MKIGLCSRMSGDWLKEFSDSCRALDYDATVVEIEDDDWMDRVAGLDMFIWRLSMSDPTCMAEARTKIPLIEQMGIPCFPDSRTLWLYDDKIRETFFLRRHQYPTPRTWVFFKQEAAERFARGAEYPLIAKSHCGASSSGVVILRSPEDGCALVKRLFKGLSLWDILIENYFYLPRLKKGDLVNALKFRYRNAWPRYAYFQEFVRTDHDWRITTLGSDLVSAFVRRNRPDDFRASGSGIWDKVKAADLPVEACDLALRISREHRFPSMTFDFMLHNGQWVIGEISYAFLLSPIYTETLFRKGEDGYRQVAPIPIGVMHLHAIAEMAGKPLSTPA